MSKKRQKNKQKNKRPSVEVFLKKDENGVGQKGILKSYKERTIAVYFPAIHKTKFYRFYTAFLQDDPLFETNMQLPPVCEMNDQSIAANPAVSVWAQSALFVEDALSGRDIASDYLNHRPASFRQMKKYDLVHTYRFGESLAAVLAKNVYSAQFHGNPESDTEIFCIHASKQYGEKNRTNLGEQIAIQRYLETHANENIGVITPYRNQREILTKTVKKIGLSPETVLTVHGAQGREWDTVLFSVVDTDGKWFTTTLIPKSNGTQIINTAVSRAKKKLILVCDCEYWSRQSNELISKLLQIARPI